LDPRKKRPAKTDLPPKSHGTAHTNVKIALAQLKQRGHDPLREPWIIDCDSTLAFMKFKHDCTPCLTCGRRHGHWISNRGRRFTKPDDETSRHAPRELRSSCVGCATWQADWKCHECECPGAYLLSSLARCRACACREVARSLGRAGQSSSYTTPKTRSEELFVASEVRTQEAQAST